jgi:hypothetical protein
MEQALREVAEAIANRMEQAQLTGEQFGPEEILQILKRGLEERCAETK